MAGLGYYNNLKQTTKSFSLGNVILDMLHQLPCCDFASMAELHGNPYTGIDRMY